MKKVNEHTTNYEIEQWAAAPTWKLIAWFLMVMVIIGVMWVVDKIEDSF